MLKTTISSIIALMIVSCSTKNYEYYTKKRDKAAAMERVYLDKKKTYVSQNPNRDKAALEEAYRKAKYAHMANKYRKIINDSNEKMSLLRIKSLSEDKKNVKKKAK